MVSAVFPGSFDPPTNGHINIIDRATKIFNKLYVVLSVNPEKKYFFNENERMRFLRETFRNNANIEVYMWDNLIVEFARKHDIHTIIRGVRALTDFEYEFELSMLNKGLNSDIETILMPTDPKYFVLRSSAIKELAMFGGDVSTMVPPVVSEALLERYRQQQNRL